MIVIANRPFKYAGRGYDRGQELDIEDSRLASRLVRTRHVVEPDRTSVETKLVVTHRPTTELREEIDVVDENGRRVVEYEIMDGTVGREQHRDPPVYRYRKQTRTTTKRGFEWYGKWYDPGDVFPEDDHLTAQKRRSLIEAGWLKEVPKEEGETVRRRTGRPKGSKNKRRKSTNTRAA